MSDSETDDCLRLSLAPPGSSRSAIATSAVAAGQPPYLSFNGIGSSSAKYSPQQCIDSSSSSVQDVPSITQYSFNIMPETCINHADDSNLDFHDRSVNNNSSSAGMSNLMEEAATWALRPSPAAMAASFIRSSPFGYNNKVEEDTMFCNNLFSNLQAQQLSFNDYKSMQQQSINSRFNELKDNTAPMLIHSNQLCNEMKQNVNNSGTVHEMDNYIVNNRGRFSNNNMHSSRARVQNYDIDSCNPRFSDMNNRSIINNINSRLYDNNAPLATASWSTPWPGLTQRMHSEYSNNISAANNNIINNDMSPSSASEHSSLLAAAASNGHNHNDCQHRRNPSSIQQGISDCINYNINTRQHQQQSSYVTSTNHDNNNNNSNNNNTVSNNHYSSSISTNSSGSRAQRGAAVSATSSSCGKEELIAAPYPWAAERRAAVEAVEVLRARGISRIWGEVTCKKCEAAQRVEVDVEARVASVSAFFLANRSQMHDRAPSVWYSPRLLDCHLCRQNDCVRPTIAPKKRYINWLFLLLTQTLGLCTLEQLKYFCKHNRKHRTGAKDRVLYLTYSGLLKQLQPSGPYD